MALTPEEQAELNALKAELGPVQPKPSLTPEEQAELAALRQELSPVQPITKQSTESIILEEAKKAERSGKSGHSG